MLPTNFVDPSATIPRTTCVWHFAVIMDGVVLGEHVSIGSRTEIGRGSVIGDGSRIGSGVFLPYHSRVGRNVFIGPNVTFTDDRYPKVLEPGESYLPEPPIIEDGASIGAGAVILPGVRIGARALIGAGAVVTRNVEAGAMVRGDPARPRERTALADDAGVHVDG